MRLGRLFDKYKIIKKSIFTIFYELHKTNETFQNEDVQANSTKIKEKQRIFIFDMLLLVNGCNGANRLFLEKCSFHSYKTTTSTVRLTLNVLQ